MRVKPNSIPAWKAVLCLKHYRTDLDVFTIPAPWTGLTVVTGLDHNSCVLVDHYDGAVARLIDMPFADLKDDMQEALNMVANDWSIVETRLKAAEFSGDAGKWAKVTLSSTASGLAGWEYRTSLLA